MLKLRIFPRGYLKETPPRKSPVGIPWESSGTNLAKDFLGKRLRKKTEEKD